MGLRNREGGGSTSTTAQMLDASATRHKSARSSDRSKFVRLGYRASPSTEVYIKDEQIWRLCHPSTQARGREDGSEHGK